MNKGLIVKIVIWNICLIVPSLFFLAAFFKANPMELNQQFVFAAIWLIVTFLLATGLAYAIHGPKEEIQELPEGSNRITVGPDFPEEG